MTQQSLFNDINVDDLGSISIRVFVLPPKPKKDFLKEKEQLSLDDLDDGEAFAFDKSATPLGSYLESSKGKRCIVFLVNGQRQESLDNSFIVQDLGFKYLRNRMMIAIDVDGLAPEALAKMMQGSRQGFYKGNIWTVIIKRIVACLKNDPELLRLEREAEELISELKSGDEKVKQTLDQLINSHHEHGWHLTEGVNVAGSGQGAMLGLQTNTQDGVVSLVSPETGLAADYPVLFSKPSSANIRLRPNQSREIAIHANPSSHWAAINHLSILPDSNVNELEVKIEKLDDHGKVTFNFKESPGFDYDQYPIFAEVKVIAIFNGIKDPRVLSLGVNIKPETVPPEPVLLEYPLKLKVSSREPIKIYLDGNDTHVRMRWDGQDSLLIGSNPTWTLAAKLIDGAKDQIVFNFSQPNLGRFSLLISESSEWKIGDNLTFEVSAKGPQNRILNATFKALVSEKPAVDLSEQKEPRLIQSNIFTGTGRRPPYELLYVKRDQYEIILSWNEMSWTELDAACFKAPTDSSPLRLIINEDMVNLREYKDELTKRLTEQEVEKRVTKYTSHIAFHLYQMYQSSIEIKEEDIDAADDRRRLEINRVSMTLIKLMEVKV